MDETVDAPIRPQLTRHSASTNDDQPMHIFDIRRSNSVTELWKKYELDAQYPVLQNPEVDSAGQGPENVVSLPYDDGNTVNTDRQRTPATTGSSGPFLAAFETELAQLLHESYISNNGPHAQEDSSALAGQNQTAGSDRQQSPTDSFAQALHRLVSGAWTFSSDMRSRMPKIEQQIRDVQRAVPGHVESTLQSALTAMESRVRIMSDALNNTAAAAAARSQGGNTSTPGGMAASTVNGLRTMASELGEMGQTLFEAFEAELACNTTTSQDHENSRLSSERQAQSAPTDGSDPAPGTQQSHQKINFDDEKESLDSNKVRKESGNTKHPGGNEDSGPSAQPQQPEHPQAPPRPGPDPHNRRPVDLPHNTPSPHPFGPRYALHLPPPRPHHIFPYHHAPPPPPPVPSFQTHPIHNSFWQPHHPHPWSRVPHHPLPPPQPRPWQTGWAPVSRPDSYNQAPAPGTPGSSQNGTGHTVKSLFIGNVGFNVTEKMIKDVFASQGFLVEVHLPLDWQTRKHAGFGYLFFASIHAAKAALEALQGIVIDGHSINLEFNDLTPITDVQNLHDNDQSTSRPDSNNTGAIPDTPELPGPRQLINDSTRPNQTSRATKSAETSALLDRDNEDSEFSARYPSLIPESSRRPTSNPLPHLSLESGMSRFPPVSQLDAHMVANQRRGTESNPSPRASNGESGSTVHRRSPFLDRSCSYRNSEHRRHDSRLLRRSNTMMPAHPASRLAGPFDPMAPTETPSATRELRRRATEIHSLLSNPQNSQSASSLERPYRNMPGSFPVGDERQHPVPDRNLRHPSPVNDCVDTLISLGYGSADEGGSQRLQVYAAAADGKVTDAIEMIEDERKVYSQRR